MRSLARMWNRLGVRAPGASALVFWAAVLLIVAALAQVVHKKMDHTITWGPDADDESMSVAISNMVYRLHQGYLMYAAVSDIFSQRLGVSTAAPGDVPHLQRMNDADYINETIHRAVSIDTITTGPMRGPHDFTPILRRDLVPVMAEDIGRADYYELAFRLFGFKVQSMHFLYFVIVSLTCLIYYLSFRRDMLALTFLIAYLVVLNGLIATSDLFSVSFPSVTSYRGISALAIVPLMHLMICIFRRVRWRSMAAVGGAVQGLIFVFVMWSRSSAEWGVVAVAVYAFLIWLHGLWSGSARSVPLWPVLFVVIGGAGLSFYSSKAVSPAYFTDDLLPGHVVWHSAYIGLSLNPHWPDNGFTGDGIAFEPATKYLKQTRPDLIGWGPLTNGYRFRLHDQAVRHLFLDFAIHNPLYMVALYLWWKPLHFIDVYRTGMSSWFRWLPLSSIIVVLGVAGALTARRLGREWYGWCVGAVTITTVLLVCSALPNLWAYPALQVMADSITTTSMWLIVVTWALLGTAYLQVSQLWAQLAGNQGFPGSAAQKSKSTWLGKLRLMPTKEPQ